MIVSEQEWITFLANCPEAHLLQTAPWGALKDDFGWEPVRVVVGDVGVQVLFRKLPLGFSIAYIPKGPVGEDWSVLWLEIDALCKQKKAVFVKVTPDGWDDEAFDATGLLAAGFRASAHFIQPPRTITLDIGITEDEILARMKQKTRYNIRLAGKKGVTVRVTDDVKAFSEMMDVTGARDAFGVHSYAYYQRAYDLFAPTGMCELLIAEFEGEPLAGLMAFARGGRAWYLYGASTNQHRNKMPTYLLQWEAIRWAKEKGCTEYDLWGAPDEDAETLEAQFKERHDGLWGVYRFKRGFGGDLKRAVGVWDKVYMPLLYKVYKWRYGGS